MLLGVTDSMAVTQKPKADVTRDRKVRIFKQLDNLNNHTDKQCKAGESLIWQAIPIPTKHILPLWQRTKVRFVSAFSPFICRVVWAFFFCCLGSYTGGINECTHSNSFVDKMDSRCFTLWGYLLFFSISTAIVHPKIKLLLSFTHLRVLSNLYDFLSPVKRKGEC